MRQASFEDATAFDTAIHMLDPHPTLRQFLIRRLLLVGQCSAPWFAGRRLHRDIREGKGQKAQILQ